MDLPKKKKRKISHAGARQKGLQFERDVAEYFRMIGFLKAGRKLEFQKAHANGVDLQDVGPFKIQCKKFQKYPSMSLIEEIKDKTGIPVLIGAGNLKPALATLPLTELLKLIEVYMRAKPQELQDAFQWSDPVKFDLGF